MCDNLGNCPPGFTKSLANYSSLDSKCMLQCMKLHAALKLISMQSDSRSLTLCYIPPKLCSISNNFVSKMFDIFRQTEQQNWLSELSTASEANYQIMHALLRFEIFGKDHHRHMQLPKGQNCSGK